MLRLVTGGESHGKCLTGILEGMPSGLPIDLDFCNLQLHRRQLGYGRGGRMKIEKDEIEITSGVRHGKTLGTPLSFLIRNRDWEHWQTAMSCEPVAAGVNIRPVTRPRPGHADLAGGLKHLTHDLRDILERASARETAARVAAGSLAQSLLRYFHIGIMSHVVAIGGECIGKALEEKAGEELAQFSRDSEVNCADPDAAKRMIASIDAAKKEGDTLGGIFEVIGLSVPPGLGSHSQWNRKLDGLIAQAFMSIPAVKAVEIGSGISSAHQRGSVVHDEIYFDEARRRFYRKTNRAGGIEGGISNGESVRIRAFVKPIPTLRKPLRSVDVYSKQAFDAAFERSDTCIVPAAGVIGEAMLSLVLADAFTEKFGGDSIAETEANHANYMRLLDSY